VVRSGAAPRGRGAAPVQGVLLGELHEADLDPARNHCTGRGEQVVEECLVLDQTSRCTSVGSDAGSVRRRSLTHSGLDGAVTEP